MMAKLIPVGGAAQSAEINLRLPSILGRGRQANITLPHSLISRQHCEIYEVNGQLIVRDLGSMNGTLVNRFHIEQPTVLHCGDTLTVGPITFRVELTDSSATKNDTTDDTAIANKSDDESAKMEPQLKIFKPDLSENSVAPPDGSSIAAKVPVAAGPTPASNDSGLSATEPDPDDGLEEFLRNLK